MACYICGAHIPRGQGYRRVVATGSSFGFTSRGTFSGRSYSGPRTLCADCAAQYDADAADSFKTTIFTVIALVVIGSIVVLLLALVRP